MTQQMGGDRRERTRSGPTPAKRLAGAVLVVDDDSLMRQLMIDALLAAGLPTIEAGSGVDALRLLAEHRVSAVVVDLHLPDMSGIDLTRRLRDMDGKQLVPVLFHSADDSADTRLAALGAGATDFMVKPLPLDEMAARVQAQLRLSSCWHATVAASERRTRTVASLAALAADAPPHDMARVICERISLAHGGRGVAVFALVNRLGSPALISFCGSSPRLRSEAATGMLLIEPDRAWIHHEQGSHADRADGTWWACAPLWRGASLVGVLALESDDRKPSSAQRQQILMAAAMDYASTVALQLGPAITESRRTRRHREIVETVMEGAFFRPVYQPVIDLRLDQVVGYEALTRTDDGRPILDLLADADLSGMRADVELTLLAAALQEAGPSRKDIWLSINLSPSVLVRHRDRLAELVEVSDHPIVIELTENEPIDDYPRVRQALAGLGQRVKLSVDDTGAGYASMRHVVDLRPHFLKLDRSWVVGVSDDQIRQAFIAGMVAFCEHTGTDLIAEGIETREELNVLRSLGVGFGQGYLLGRPAPMDSFSSAEAS